MALNRNYQAEVGVSFNDTKLRKQLETLNGKTIKVNVEVKGGLGNLNKALKDTNQLLKETEKNLRNVTKSSKELDTGVKNLNKSNVTLGGGLDNVTKKTKKAADAFNHTANHGKSFSAMITDIAKKVTAFGSVTDAINTVKRVMGEAVGVTFAYDAALTDFKKVSDLSGESLDTYAEKLEALGKDVYRTRTEMVQSATLFKQAGFSDDDSAQLARVAEMYRNVADAQITSGEASAFVVSQMKAYGVTAENAISIIDKVNEVSNNFAVSSSDIASGLTRNSAALATYGNTLNESIAMVTAGAEIMTGKAGQVSNGLKSVGANIAKLAQESSVLEVKAKGTAHAIDLIDESTGDLKSTFSIMEDLKDAWDDMSQAEKTNLGLKLAGKTQFAVFSSVMDNFTAAIEANEVAMKSSGSAMEENEKRADSLEVKVKAIRAEFERLVLGKGGLMDLGKGFLDVSRVIVKFLADTNALPILIADTGVVLGMVLLPKLITLKKTLVENAVAMVLATKNTGSLSAGLKQVGITASTAQLAVGALTAVISIGIMAWNAYNSAQEQARMLAKQTADENFSQAKAIDTVLAKLRDESKSRNDLVEAIYDVNSKYKEELGNIEDVNEMRAKGIELLEKERKEKLDAARAAMLADAVEAKRKLSESSQVQTNVGQKYLGTPSGTGVRNAAVYEYENLEKQTQALKEAAEAAYEAVQAGEEQEYVLKRLQDLYNKSAEELARYTEISETFDSFTAALTQRFDENGNAVEENAAAYKDWFNDMNDDEVDAMSKALKMSADAFRENAAAMGLSLQEYGGYLSKNAQLATEMENTSGAIDSLQSALGVAKTAWDEYSKEGMLTLDTFQNLMAISPEYLGALINQEGQLSVNEQTLGNLVEQLKVAKIEELQTAAAADIMALAHGENAKMSDTARAAISNLEGNIVTAGNEASSAAGKMMGFAAGVYSAVKATEGAMAGELPDNFEAQQQAIIDAYAKMGEKISSISVDTSKNVATGYNKGAKSGKKAAKDTTDAYKEEYEKQLKELDHKLAMEEISEEDYYEALIALNEKYFGEASGQHEKYLDEYRKNQEKIYKWEEKQRQESLKAQKSLYDKALEHMQTVKKKQLDMLKEERDEELAYLDDRIDRVEKQRDREVKAIDKKLKLLKEEKKVAIENLDVQINGLQDLRDKEKTYWDEKIDAFKAQNKELQEQIDLQKLQEQLALAKSGRAMILKDGKFVQGEKESDVANAEQAIQDYYDNLKQQKELQAMEDARDASLKYYQAQIDSLKLYKEDMSNEFDAQIDRLQEHKEQLEEYYEERLESMKEHRAEVQEEYDGQIEDMEKYIEQFDEMVNEYETTQNRMAFIQLQGAEQEKKIWDNRLDNFREFVREYNSLKAELDDEKSSSSSKSSGRSVSSTNIVPGRATGDASVSKDGWSMIGDDPNHQELLIGSKLNGSFTKISKGDGVVNAEGTKTLAGFINGLAGRSSLGNVEHSSGGGDSYSLHIDKVDVNADDAKSFTESLFRDFNVRIKQDAFRPSRA